MGSAKSNAGSSWGEKDKMESDEHLKVPKESVIEMGFYFSHPLVHRWLSMACSPGTQNTNNKMVIK